MRAILCGSVWNGFFLGKARKEDVPCRYCGKRDGDGHLFWERTFPLPLHVRELPEFATRMSLDSSLWPRCLLWHGWLPGLSGIGGSDPWATSFGEGACGELERCLGAYPVDCSGYWTPPEYWDADDIALEMSDAPNIWTDGCREDFSSIGGFEVFQKSKVMLAWSWPCHLGIVKDGDLVALVQHMIRTRGRETVQGHQGQGAC